MYLLKNCIGWGFIFVEIKASFYENTYFYVFWYIFRTNRCCFLILTWM